MSRTTKWTKMILGTNPDVNINNLWVRFTTFTEKDGTTKTRWQRFSRTYNDLNIIAWTIEFSLTNTNENNTEIINTKTFITQNWTSNAEIALTKHTWKIATVKSQSNQNKNDAEITMDFKMYQDTQNNGLRIEIDTRGIPNTGITNFKFRRIHGTLIGGYNNNTATLSETDTAIYNLINEQINEQNQSKIVNLEFAEEENGSTTTSNQ